MERNGINTDTETLDLVEFATKHNLTNEQVEKLEAMEPEARAEHIAILEQSLADAEAFNFVEIEEEAHENMKVFTVGDLVAGQALAGRLKGVRHIYSKKLKENWKEFVQPDGQVLYYNSMFIFEGITDKKEWGIFKSPTLSLLEKMPTKSSGSGKKDPAVKLTYIGKVEGREVLEREHGIKLTKGHAAHVFKISTEPNTEILKYEVRGVVNSLNSPLPMSSKAAAGTDKTQASVNNFKRLQAANMGVSSVLLSDTTH